MRNILTLLLMVTVALATTWGHDHIKPREKRELLLRSKRRWVLSTIEIVEEDPGPFPKATTQMFNDKKKQDADQKFRISGSGVDEDPVNIFTIDEKTGTVYVHKSIDREKNPFFHIKFDILGKDNILIDRTLAFDVNVKDINDKAPFFNPAVIRQTIKENVDEGLLSVPLQVFDEDEDKTINSTVTISLVSQEPKEPKINVFQTLDTRTGHLTFTGCFDYDKFQNYKVILEAKDHGIQPLSSSATIYLTIEDSNTHMPIFKDRQYSGEVLEMESNKEVLRVAVEDKDTRNTPGWKASYFFIRGNEDADYKIETDPKTNDGVLTIVKGKDFERTITTTLQIGVKNEEKLFVCGAMTGVARPPHDSVNITIKVIDVNDPPQFDKNNFNIYLKEEDEPGKALYKPVVTDEDSDIAGIRFDLIEDPANWVTIDNKTGQLTTAKKMDRESPFVNNSIYKILVTAKDDGAPPATSTCTVLVHLTDINDHRPRLVHPSLYMCGNKNNKIMVPANDQDVSPFSGPFTFSLGKEDETLKQRWKLDPSTGESGGLISLRSLPYGNYSVPLVIQDQQGETASESLIVVICDCGEEEMCREKQPASSNIAAAAIVLILASLLLLFLLLLCVFFCDCGKAFKHIPIPQNEGNQTLIRYNEEGGGSECKAEPFILLTPGSSYAVTDGLKQATIQTQRPFMYPMIAQDTHINRYNTMNSHMNSMGAQQQSLYEYNETLRSHGQYSTWNRTSNTNGSGYSFILQSSEHIADHLDRKLDAIAGDQDDHLQYQPCAYAYEGHGTSCQSLDQLSLNTGGGLEFLTDLDPKFKHLGSICQQHMQEKNTQL